MAISITPIQETRTITEVQITGFSMDYENMSMTSSYMTILDDGTPYQRGQVTITDVTEMNNLMGEVQTRVLNGENIDEASSEVAYNLVVSKLGA